MSITRAIAAAELDLAQLGHSGLDSRSLRLRMLERLRRLIPFEAAWFAMADPATLLFTDAVRVGIPAELTPRFVEDEFLHDDFNKWMDLARSAGKANGLQLASPAGLAASFRYSEILEPAGYGDELRGALTADGCCWGFICLHRARGDRLFATTEAVTLGRLAQVLARGLRESLLMAAATEDEEDAGVIMLSSNLELAGLSARAERLLADIAEPDWPPTYELPPVILAVAGSARWNRAMLLVRRLQRVFEPPPGAGSRSPLSASPSILPAIRSLSSCHWPGQSSWRRWSCTRMA